ncbi:hypothetical protein FOVSG1_009411 [Fusarium oxysporum f. sp. vasinfectum]
MPSFCNGRGRHGRSPLPVCFLIARDFGESLPKNRPSAAVEPEPEVLRSKLKPRARKLTVMMNCNWVLGGAPAPWKFRT